MSLIRVRRKRKQNWIQEKKPTSPVRLILLLVAVVAMIWYLGTRI